MSRNHWNWNQVQNNLFGSNFVCYYLVLGFSVSDCKLVWSKFAFLVMNEENSILIDSKFVQFWIELSTSPIVNLYDYIDILHHILYIHCFAIIQKGHDCVMFDAFRMVFALISFCGLVGIVSCMRFVSGRDQSTRSCDSVTAGELPLMPWNIHHLWDIHIILLIYPEVNSTKIHRYITKPGGDKPLFKLGAFESFLAGAGVVLLINIVLLLQGELLQGAGFPCLLMEGTV